MASGLDGVKATTAGEARIDTPATGPPGPLSVTRDEKSVRAEDSGSLNVTVSTAAGSTWIAPLAGTAVSTDGGVRSTVWNRVLTGCPRARPNTSVTLVGMVTVSCLSSGQAVEGAMVRVTPSGPRLAVEMVAEDPSSTAAPKKDCTRSEKTMTTGWFTPTCVAPSAGVTETTAMGVSSRTMVPTLRVCRFVSRLWPWTSPSPEVSGSLARRVKAPRGTPFRVKVASPWAWVVRDPRPRSRSTLTEAP